jgi:hypothetical protein
MSKKSSHLSSAQIRSWLVTALGVFVALSILLAVIRPFLPFVVVGIVLITIAVVAVRARPPVTSRR